MNCLKFFVVLSVCLCTISADDHNINYVKKYNTEEFKNEIAKNPHLVLFYAPWCGHCKRTMPDYEELGKKYNENDQFKTATIAMVDCTKDTGLCSEHNVNGYPTIKFFFNGGDEEYNGGRSIIDFDTFLQIKLGIQPTINLDDKPKMEIRNYVKIYTKDNFEQTISDGFHLIKFFAPWCTHCKNMAKSWEDLATDLSSRQQEMNIAEVDCTVNGDVCQKFGVNGYPTILFFSGGRQLEKYNGERSLDGFKKFVNEIMNIDDTAKASEEEKITKVITLTKENHDMTNNGHHFVKYYAPWCQHCQELAPVWEKLAESFEDDETVKISKIDCTAESDICPRSEIHGYPTLWWITDGKKIEKYSGPRDIEDLQDFVNSMRGKKDDVRHSTIEDKKVEFVQSLTVDTFEEVIAGSKSFIKFYAPWCGHCKRMAPAWEELGKKYAGHESVIIAEVDCTKNREICDKHEVTGFPTLYWFENGKRITEHSGTRELEDLVKFIQEKLSHDEL